MRIVLIGATGMVGQGVLRACLKAPDVTEIILITALSQDQYTFQGPAFDLTATERVVMQFYCNSPTKNHTIDIRFGGGGYQSVFTVPILFDHDELSGIDGAGTWHLSQTAAQNAESLKTVAMTGSYTDLINTPTIPPGYTLPPATTTTLGGIIAGPGTSIAANGTLTASGAVKTVNTNAPDANGNVSVFVKNATGTSSQYVGLVSFQGGTGDPLICGKSSSICRWQPIQLPPSVSRIRLHRASWLHSFCS
jgi:hypothetical protein